MDFKDKLKELRQGKNLTQKELAEKLFVSRSAIAKWENGVGSPSDESLDNLCNFFNVKREELFCNTENECTIISKRKKKYNQRVLVLSLASLLIIAVIMICFLIPKRGNQNSSEKLLYVECPKISLNENMKYIAVNPVVGKNVVMRAVDDFYDKSQLEVIQGAYKCDSYSLNIDIEYESIEAKYFYLDNDYNYLEENGDEFIIQEKLPMYPGAKGYNLSIENNTFSIPSNDYYNLIRIDVNTNDNNQELRFRYIFLFV